MSDFPLVSVIIPHYNDLEHLQKCLASLRRQRFPDASYEVIIADNNSSCGIDAIKSLAYDMRVISATQQGAGPARNAGAAAAHGTYLAFIDSDCVAEQDWLTQGTAALENFDYVGGHVITTVSDTLTIAEAFEAVFAFDFKKYIEKDKFSGTGNLFVPRRVFCRVGGFRASVSEDIDWCHRANAMGFRLGYAKNAVVYHPARREWSELTRRWDRVMKEMISLAMEGPAWRLHWMIYSLKVALSPSVHWTLVVRSDRLRGFAAKWRSVVGLTLIRAYRSYRMICLLVRPPTT